MSLTPAELEAMRDEAASLARVGPGRDPKVTGCFVAFFGMIVLTLTPAVGGWLDIPPGLALGILTGAVLLLMGGALIGLVGGSRQESGAARVREEALDTLRGWVEGRASSEAAVRAAVRFLRAGGGRLYDVTSELPPEAAALLDRVARAELDG